MLDSGKPDSLYFTGSNLGLRWRGVCVCVKRTEASRPHWRCCCRERHVAPLSASLIIQDVSRIGFVETNTALLPVPGWLMSSAGPALTALPGTGGFISPNYR